MFENKKVLIFDLDGTIADTIPAITEGINLAMQEMGLPLHTEDQVRTYVNFGPRHLITQALPQVIKEHDPDIVDKALSVYNKMYDKTYINTNVCYDGIPEVIRELSKKYTIAVLSNKQDEYVKALVSQLLPSGTCAAAYGSLDGIPAKPEPKRALMLTKFLSVSPSDCVLIGDSQVDIRTAEAAGFDSIAVSWGYVSREKLIENGAKIIVDSPSELIDILG